MKDGSEIEDTQAWQGSRKRLFLLCALSLDVITAAAGESLTAINLLLNLYTCGGSKTKKMQHRQIWKSILSLT